MFLHSDVVLEVDKVSKLYARQEAPKRKRLVALLARSFLGQSPKPIESLYKNEFWALKDISFSLRRGEAIGVIGLNGAGKTTLLRLLAGQLLPDEGEIRLLGRSAAMIDLTAGFQMSASGKRNVFLRGAMLGRSANEVSEVYDEILDFAELGKFIEAPVSTYSSGMQMRLAFSIMVAFQPDVLFIDEILSVGDFRFRQKCLGKIRELRDNAAVVLVSHSMSNVKLFCDRVIVLCQGKIAYQGAPEEAIRVYEEMKFADAGKEQKRVEILKPQFHNREIIKGIEHHWCNEEGEPISEIDSGATLYFKVTFSADYTPRNFIMGVPLWTEEGGYVTGFSTELQDKKLSVSRNTKTSFLLEIKQLPLNPGVYLSNFVIADGPEFLYRGENPTLTVRPAQHRFWGVVTLPHTWRALTEMTELNK